MQLRLQSKQVSKVKSVKAGKQEKCGEPRGEGIPAWLGGEEGKGTYATRSPLPITNLQALTHPPTCKDLQSQGGQWDLEKWGKEDLTRETRASDLDLPNVLQASQVTAPFPNIPVSKHQENNMHGQPANLGLALTAHRSWELLIPRVTSLGTKQRSDSLISLIILTSPVLPNAVFLQRHM
jgi:hypothetical protein